MNADKNEPKILQLQETVSLDTAGRFAHNYRNPNQALDELIDNAADNRIMGQPSRIYVCVSRNELFVANRGGKGAGLPDLERYLHWGESEQGAGRIGRFGVGGKSAALYLGGGIDIRCSAAGELTEYHLAIPKWGERSSDVASRTHKVVQTPIEDNEGYFLLKVTDLQRRVDPNMLIRRLGNVYRFLLERGDISLLVRDTKWPQDRTVAPIEIPYLLDNDFRQAPLVFTSGFGEDVKLTVGFLDEEKLGKDSPVRGGLRVLYRGKLLKDGVLPAPRDVSKTRIESLFNHGRLLGEMHLDHVPTTTDKSAFDEASPQYIDALNGAYYALQPTLAKLKDLPVSSRSRLEAYESRIATTEIDRVLGLLLRDSEYSFDPSMTKSTELQKRPLTKSTGEPGRDKRTVTPGGAKGVNPKDAQKFESKRVSKKGGAIFSKTEPISLGEQSAAYQVVEVEGQRVLRINIDRPRYQKMKSAGVDSLKIHFAELAVRATSGILAEQNQVDRFTLYERLEEGLDRIYASEQQGGKSGKR
jgi:hypothetical protein